MLHCNPRFDIDGVQWEMVGRDYESFCKEHNIDWTGISGLESDQIERRSRGQTQYLWHWDITEKYEAHTLEMKQFKGDQWNAETGWLNLGGYKQDEKTMQKHWRQLTHCAHEVTRCTRHIAGTHRLLRISPHGWIKWDDMMRYLWQSITWDNQKVITESMLLSKMERDVNPKARTTGCRGDSTHPVADACLEHGKERFQFLVLRESNRVYAIRATHGMSASLCLPKSFNHAQFPLSALKDVPALFHRTTTKALPDILRYGLRPMKRIGTMLSLYPPWDPRARNMQRGGTETHDVRLVFNTRKMFAHFGWAQHHCKIWLSEAGACIPCNLPIDTYCKQIVLLDLKMCAKVAEKGARGDVTVDLGEKVGTTIFDVKFKESSYKICGKVLHNEPVNTVITDDCGLWGKFPCPSCRQGVLPGFVACPYCKTFFMLEDKKTGMQFSPSLQIYKTIPLSGPKDTNTSRVEIRLTEGQRFAKPNPDLKMIPMFLLPKAIKFRGMTRGVSPDADLAATCHTTIRWQMRWLLNLFKVDNGHPGMNGASPCFMNWGKRGWAIRSEDPWHPMERRDWPELNKIRMTQLQKVIAWACWTVVDEAMIELIKEAHKQRDLLSQQSGKGSKRKESKDEQDLLEIKQFLAIVPPPGKELAPGFLRGEWSLGDHVGIGCLNDVVRAANEKACLAVKRILAVHTHMSALLVSYAAYDNDAKDDNC